MKRLFYLSLITSHLSLFIGCATTPRIAPRFVAPSTAPIAQATKAAKDHVQSAQVILRQIQVESPQSRAQILAVSKDLDETLVELQTSEGARIQLETQLKQQTAQANNLADNYDKQAVVIESLKASRQRWVKLFSYSVVATALCAVWIFRKPLLRMAGATFGL